MADRPQIIGTDDKGQFQVPLPRAQIERIDVIDIDFVLQTKSGERLIIPGAAMDAMTAAPPTVVFTDGPINAAALLGMVEKVETPPVSIPAMTSLKEFDQKRTEGQKNVTRDGAEGRQTKSGEDAEPQHQTQEQAQQVAPLPHQGAESTVDKLLAQAENLEAETLKKAFDPAPIKPYEPPASNPDAPGSQPPTARIPLYMALAEGNVVGVSNTTIADTPTLLAKSGGVDILADTAVTYTNLVSGSSGPEDVAATTADNEGSSVADGILPGDAKQYGTETLIGGAGNDLVLADGYHGTGFENTQAMYAQLDPETGTGGTLYYAKEFKLSVAGYIRTVTSITISGLPEGVVALVLNGVTYSVANGKLVDGTVSIPTGDIIPDAKTMTIIYDANAVATSAAGVDAEISVNVKGYGVGPIDTTKVFVWRFQDVDSTSDITGNNPKYIQGDGEHVSSGWSDIYVMETASAPHLILTFGGTYDTALSFGANVAANAALAATDGANLVYAGNSNDTIIAGNGNDTIFSYAGNDTIHAGNGTNVVWAGAGDDTVITGAGDDSVLAGGGNDVVTTGAGDDYIDGGAGNDVIIAGIGNNIVVGGEGRDTLSFADAAINGVTLTLDANGDRSGAMTRSDGGSDTITGIENLIGSAGDDTLTFIGSGEVANTVWGGNGNDVIDTGDGDDVIYGEAGDDQLFGGLGNDVIDGGGGDDTITGGDGADTLRGGAGNDTFIAVLNDGADVIDGGAGLFNKVDYSIETAQITINLSDDNPTGSGGSSASGDTYANIQWLVGGGNVNGDTLTGSSGAAEILEGRGGDDLLYAVGDGDTLYGDMRNADESSADSSNRATSYALTNWSNAYNWQNSVNGTNWNNPGYNGDRLYGAGAKGIVDTDTTTTMYGGAGFNQYILYGETDIVNGGTNDGSDFDRILYNNQNVSGTVADTGLSGSGVFINIDTMSHAWDSSGVVDSGAIGYWWNGGGWVAMVGFDDTNANSGHYGWAENDTYSDIEQVVGTKYADVIFGNDEDNYINAGDGNDAVFGLGGDDWFAYNQGNDRIDGGTNNAVTLASGGDIVDYSGNASALVVNLDRLNGSVTGYGGYTVKLIDIEGFIGGNANDTITGSSGADRIDGRGGSDTVDAGDGNDIVYAGWGNRTTTNGSGWDVLDGGDGVDWVSYSGIGQAGSGGLGIEVYLADADLDGDGRLDQETGWGVYKSYQSRYDLGGTYEYDKLSNFENVEGSAYADRIAGTTGANSISALGGDDLIYGGGGGDYIDGGAGSDTISYYGLAAVTVDLSNNANNAGGAAGDTLVSIENVYGTAFADILTGDGNANVLRGYGGNDVLNGGAGSDTADYSYLTTSSVSVVASLLTNTAVVSSGDDSDTFTSIENLIGGSGNDTLTGDANANTIYGGAGDDIINGGGGGADKLYGEAGNDRLVLTLAQMNNATVDGGDGTDTLAVADWNLSSNFNDGRIKNIEAVDVRDGNGGDTTSALTYDRISQILDSTTNNSKLVLYLDAGDTYTYTGSTTTTGSGTVSYASATTATYNYTSGSNTLKVEVHWG